MGIIGLDPGAVGSTQVEIGSVGNRERDHWFGADSTKADSGINCANTRTQRVKGIKNLQSCELPVLAEGPDDAKHDRLPVR